MAELEASGARGPGGQPAAQAPAGRRWLGLLVGAGLFCAGVAGAGALLVAKQGREQHQAEAAMRAAVEQRFAPQRAEWRARQDARMKGELSPLARIDYVHLDALAGWPREELVVGAADGLPVPAEALGAHQGRVALARVEGPQGPELFVRAQPVVTVRRQRKGEGARPLEETGEELRLRSGDVVLLGRARLLVAGLWSDPAVAVYDQRAPAMVGYHGLSYYPDDARYLALAKLSRHAAPRRVQVQSSRGGPQVQVAVGMLTFEIAGVPCQMEAFSEDSPDHLFLVFRDKTSGAGSYGAGRFLNAQVLPGDQVVLDFNQAWNPLCAYSSYFHCPMPPKQNHLPVAIPAGEKTYSDH